MRDRLALLKRSCMDNVYTLNKLCKADEVKFKKTYVFFFDIQKA